jgi:hypothetical protein
MMEDNTNDRIKDMLKLIPDDALFKEAAHRMGKRGGRPKKMSTCPLCGETMDATTYRKHIPDCSR